MVKRYVLGRECTLLIDFTLIPEVADVLVREYTTEMDATGRTHSLISTIVTHRTYEISLTIPEMTRARWLHSRRWVKNGDFMLPRVMSLNLQGGGVDIFEKFVMADVDADETLDDVVSMAFSFKQWGHG